MPRVKNPNRRLTDAQARLAEPHSLADLVTTIIPTIHPPRTLSTVLDCLKRQTISTKLLIVDTGSPAEEIETWQKNHEHHTDVSWITFKGETTINLSQPIAEALDIAIALCRTPFAFLTHDDTWLTNRTLIAHELDISAKTGARVVGYEMSEREWITPDWRGMVSHTATLLHVPTAHQANLRWSLIDAITRRPDLAGPGGWPDTETHFGWSCRAQGIHIELIGHENNQPHYADHWLTHRRSYTSHRMYAPQEANADTEWIDQMIIAVETHALPY